MKKVKKKVAGVMKGGPSAVLLSIVIHVVFFLLAGMLVIFTVVKKEEQVFEQPKSVERPKMKLKKPKVRVKTSKPKSTTRIVTKANLSAMPDLQLPELGGLEHGLGGGIGDGFDIMPDLGEVSVFGTQHSIGNDFEGTVYSLVLGRDGHLTSMGQDMFREKLRKYVLSGWKESVLAPYYRAPTKLYSTFFMVPPIPTAMGPDAFGVPDLELYWLFVKYEGQLVYPEDIKFRFWGIGDAFIFVNVGGKEVLLNAWLSHYAYFDWWQSSAGSDRTYVLGNQFMVVGDWIELKAGEPLDMKVLFGEWNGGSELSGMLLVEVEGEEYPTSRTGGPLLPAFKTAEFSWEQLTEISRFLAANECTLTNGPVFNDYYTPPTSPKTVVAALPPEVKPAAPSAEESGTRLWALADGKTMDAELVTMVAGHAVFKNEKGRQIKVPMMQLSDADRSLIRLSLPPTLDINFSKKTKQRTFGTNFNGKASPVRGAFYTFSTQIKQSSVRPYGHPLTAECFVIGDEVGGNKHVLLDYQKAAFSLTRENKHAFEFSGPPVELLDYIINNEHRGQRYGGFLVVIKDSRGEIVAYKTPSEKLYRNLDNLRKLRVGWYFDDEGNCCLPTPPKSYGRVGKN